MSMIKRSAEGVEVTIYTDSWPAVTRIEVTSGNGTADEIRLFRIEQAEGLQYALNAAIASYKEKERERL